MIIVLVGTNPYSFDRLVKAVDDYARAHNEKVFIQLGHTKYEPKYSEYVPFLKKSALIMKIEEAELVIIQGGFGGIADCLSLEKRVIAVPRKPELREAPDDQEELVRALEMEGRLIGVYDINDLPAAINKVKSLEIKPGAKSQIPKIISEFIAKH